MIHLEYHEEGDTVTATAKGSYKSVIAEICLLIAAICKTNDATPGNDLTPKKMLKDIKALLLDKQGGECIKRILRSSSQEKEAGD